MSTIIIRDANLMKSGAIVFNNHKYLMGESPLGHCPCMRLASLASDTGRGFAYQGDADMEKRIRITRHISVFIQNNADVFGISFKVFGCKADIIFFKGSPSKLMLTFG
ncbi:MAG: hypothetical protein AAGU16_00595 [Desulfitobacterium hafniense]